MLLSPLNESPLSFNIYISRNPTLDCEVIFSHLGARKHENISVMLEPTSHKHGKYVHPTKNLNPFRIMPSSSHHVVSFLTWKKNILLLVTTQD